MNDDSYPILKSIDRKLTTVLNLLTYQMVEGKTLTESAPVLRRLGLTPVEIASIFGSTAKVVSVRLAEAKKKRGQASRK